MKKPVKQSLAATILLFILFSFLPNTGIASTNTNGLRVRAWTHVQTYGEQAYKEDIGGDTGEYAGTIGEKKRLEALKVELTGAPQDMRIQYMAHIQQAGWDKGWTTGPGMVGTIGKALRMEAIKIRLVNSEGDPYKGYSVYYNSHIQGIGWEPEWKKNGQISGTTGESKRIEAIRIKVVKNLTLPETTHGFEVKLSSERFGKYSCIDINIKKENLEFKNASHIGVWTSDIPFDTKNSLGEYIGWNKPIEDTITTLVSGYGTHYVLAILYDTESIPIAYYCDDIHIDDVPFIEDIDIDATGKVLSLVFNEPIDNNRITLKNLKENILISITRNSEFAALAQQDSVSIEKNKLIVKLQSPYFNELIGVKILKDSLKNADGKVCGMDQYLFKSFLELERTNDSDCILELNNLFTYVVVKDGTKVGQLKNAVRVIRDYRDHNFTITDEANKAAAANDQDPITNNMWVDIYSDYGASGYFIYVKE